MDGDFQCTHLVRLFRVMVSVRCKLWVYQWPYWKDIKAGLEIQHYWTILILSDLLGSQLDHPNALSGVKGDEVRSVSPICGRMEHTQWRDTFR